MKINNDAIDILVRTFFHSYFSMAAKAKGIGDVTKAQPVDVKQLLMERIEDVSGEFNKRIPRAFALITGVEIPERLSAPRTFDGVSALIRFTLCGDRMLYDYMVERYKYHFTLALSGKVEPCDKANDVILEKAIKIMQ